MKDTQRHYLDSCVFSGFLNGVAEPNNFAECEAVIRAAEAGFIKAYTSAFTMAEVVYIRPAPDQQPLAIESQEEIIFQLFSSTWFERVAFEPEMAEINRYLIRQYGEGKRGLKPYDSVHIATAIRTKVDFFNTVDNELIQRLPNSVNYPPRYPNPVIIQRPFVDQFQMQLPSL